MSAEADRQEIERLEARLRQIDTGCSNCGGLPHTTDCRIRDPKALVTRAEKAEAALAKCVEALRGVVQVAGRKTVEFAAAHEALAAAREVLP